MEKVHTIFLYLISDIEASNCILQIKYNRSVENEGSGNCKKIVKVSYSKIFVIHFIGIKSRQTLLQK